MPQPAPPVRAPKKTTPHPVAGNPQGSQDGKVHKLISATRCSCGATIASGDDMCPVGAVQVT